MSDFLHPSLPGVVEARDEGEERKNHGKRMGGRWGRRRGGGGGLEAGKGLRLPLLRNTLQGKKIGHQRATALALPDSPSHGGGETSASKGRRECRRCERASAGGVGERERMGEERKGRRGEVTLVERRSKMENEGCSQKKCRKHGRRKGKDPGGRYF